jgi:hypothetical protein
VKAAGIAIASWDGSIYCSAVRLGWCASLGIAPHAQTGWTASAGFLALGAAWIVATGLAVRFILRGHAIRHRRWMIRSYALRNSGHPCLCLFHARAESQFIETERLGCDLAQTISGDFMTATDINRAMGRLYTAVAQDRIPIRNANALARIGRMMLNTIPGIKSESEFPFSYKFEEWNKMLDASKPLSLPSSAAIPERSQESLFAATPTYTTDHPHINHSSTAQTPHSEPACAGRQSEDRCLSERFQRGDRRPTERFSRGESLFVFDFRRTLSTHGLATRPGAINLGNTKRKNLSESDARHAEAFAAPAPGRVNPCASTVI